MPEAALLYTPQGVENKNLLWTPSLDHAAPPPIWGELLRYLSMHTRQTDMLSWCVFLILILSYVYNSQSEIWKWFKVVQDILCALQVYTQYRYECTSLKELSRSKTPCQLLVWCLFSILISHEWNKIHNQKLKNDYEFYHTSTMQIHNHYRYKCFSLKELSRSKIAYFHSVTCWYKVFSSSWYLR